jgi:hypothetical protein
MFIPQTAMEQLTSAHVEVFFVSGQATKWWNAQREDKKTELALLGGWYWTLAGEEAGPFRTPSAAWRDVYYRRLLEQEPPAMKRDEVVRAEKEAAKGFPKVVKKRRKRRVVKDFAAPVVRLRA